MLLTKYYDVMFKHDPFFQFFDLDKKLEKTFYDSFHFDKNCRSEIKDNLLTLNIDLPGIKPENISIDVVDKNLSISYEHKGEKKSLTYYVNEKYDPDRATAKLELGVLELKIPKVKSSETKKIKIELL